jgi:outer membrane protein assembly factor BamB
MLFLVSTQGAIQALDAKTGVQLWRTNLDGRCTYTPTVSQRDFYVTGSDSSIHCFDRVSGDHIWQESLDSRPSSRILVESDSLYTLSDSGSLYAFSQSRDETKFVNEVTPLTGASGIAITAKGNIAGVNREGEIVIFDGDTGKMQINSSDYHTTTGGLFLADTHFYACQNDILYSMNYDGSRRWSVLLESKPEYIIALDDLYVTVVEGGGERTIHRYTPSGEQRWSPQIGGVLKYSIEPTGYANREIRPVVSAK